MSILMCMLLRRETDILALSTTCEADPKEKVVVVNFFEKDYQIAKR